MKTHCTLPFIVSLVLAMVLGMGVTPGIAQVGSLDFQGPTTFGGSVSEGDVAAPDASGNLQIIIPAARLGIGPTNDGYIEVDALSSGFDAYQAEMYGLEPEIVFSVDEFALGFPGSPVLPYNVWVQGAGGFQEAAADVYMGPAYWICTPPFSYPGPIPPDAGNVIVADGDGVVRPLPTLVDVGLTGLIEPKPPTPGVLRYLGDNLDALDADVVGDGPIEPPDDGTPVFFSLDAAFADPLETAPANTGTAAANGFVGGDILVKVLGLPGPPTVYATAKSLGLDQGDIAADMDDLDAVAIFDEEVALSHLEDVPLTSTPEFDPTTDFLLFSVRRGSAIIGTLDSVLGIPIEEGDLLVPASILSEELGEPVSAPGIFLAAEWLGLATVRSGTAATYDVDGTLVTLGDDLDALDVMAEVPEPGTLAMLLGLALVPAAGLARRKRRGDW